jgi:parallel beta-helix repeat protein
MRRTILLVATMILTLLVASGVALAVGIGSAGAQSSVVGPGESIQKAINAAHPGDTIVVRGVHREDVVIRKDGIKLRGDDAVIEAPPRAKADSPCSKTFGPEAICVLGDVNIKTGELTGPRVRDVSVSGFTIRGFKVAGKGDSSAFVIDVTAARNATVVGNLVIGNVAGGIVASRSVNTTVANNHVIGNPKTSATGIVVEVARNTTVVKNVVKSIPEGENAIEVSEGIDTTIEGNDLIGNGVGVFVIDSTATKILANETREREGRWQQHLGRRVGHLHH